jgi:hypothetical protein
MTVLDQQFTQRQPDTGSLARWLGIVRLESAGMIVVVVVAIEGVTGYVWAGVNHFWFKH